MNDTKAMTNDETPNRRITIVGSYNVGLFLKGQRLPVGGETVIADSFTEGGGGKGSNQAVAATRLGGEVQLIARLGEDKYGREAMQMYQRLGLNTDTLLLDPQAHSGISVILIDDEGHNMISVARGANANLSNEDLDRLAGTLAASKIVGFQLENNTETVFHGIRRAHAMGITTFLDPAPACPLPDDLLPCLDLVKPNETEASIITGIPVSDAASAERAGRWLVEHGVGRAIVTLGAGGAVVVEERASRHYPPPRVKAIDTTGAGDVFAGAMLAMLAEDHPLGRAVTYANAAASLSTRVVGVIEAIPDPAQVDALLQTEVAT